MSGTGYPEAMTAGPVGRVAERSSPPPPPGPPDPPVAIAIGAQDTRPPTSLVNDLRHDKGSVVTTSGQRQLSALFPAGTTAPDRDTTVQVNHWHAQGGGAT